jgi:hypothetical protein
MPSAAVAATARRPGVHADRADAVSRTRLPRPHGRREAAHKCHRRPRTVRGRRRERPLDQLHFCVPVTVLDDGVPPGPVSAVNVTLYGRLPLLQATDVP